MATIYKVDCQNRMPLSIGVQEENLAHGIQFDITPWIEEHGAGAVTANAQRPTDAVPYPVIVQQDGNIVTWRPKTADVAIEGTGAFQLIYTVGEVVARTQIWATNIGPSLIGAGDPPDPIDDWLDDMREVAADAQQSANDSAASAQQAAQEVLNAQAEVYEAEAWAKGTKNGTPVSSSDAQYQNNAKYYSEESNKNAEAWAVGQRGGVDVPSTDPTYENNAKYYAEQAETIKDGTQAIVDEARADVFEAMDGLHEDTTAGTALQLISDKRITDKVPYLFRKSGGGKSIGNREIDTLVGGSVAFNQLAHHNEATSDLSGVTYTNNGDGSWSVNGTATAQSSKRLMSFPQIQGHKYYVTGNFSGGSDSTYFLFPYNNDYAHDFGAGQIKQASTSSNISVNLYVRSGITVNLKVTPQIFDLTQMFGTAVADRLYAMEQANTGSGVALFRSWFPKDYYAYNEGTLMSVKTTAHEMVGFNQWDEEWESGYWDVTTGEKVASDVWRRCANYIPVFPNTDYYFKVTLPSSGAFGAFAFLDSDKKVVSYISNGTEVCNTVFTTPANAMYLVFYLSANWFANPICINLSSDRNGEYEPYTKHTYALDDVELRGVPKLVDGEIQYDGDTYEADGTVTRKYGIVDLGTLTWSLAGGSFYRATLSGAVAGLGECICDKRIYKAGDRNAITNENEISPYNVNAQYICGLAGSYADAAAFKASMSGVYLVYELATPTTETADPFTSPQIVDAYGTERYVDERTVAVPVGHVTKYPDNLREKLDGLPWNFSTLIAPTEKAYKATRNYTTGSLFIVGNVLYKATANIANGGTITPNTNCTATTLAEVISAL